MKYKNTISYRQNKSLHVDFLSEDISSGTSIVFLEKLEGRHKIIKQIRAVYPAMKITIRADSGFSNAPFYKLADDHELFYAVGMATNERLKIWTNFTRLIISSLAWDNLVNERTLVS